MELSKGKLGVCCTVKGKNIAWYCAKQKLDKTQKFTCDPQLLRWENKIKNIIERKTFEHRNQLDEYIKEELMYFPETL